MFNLKEIQNFLSQLHRYIHPLKLILLHLIFKICYICNHVVTTGRKISYHVKFCVCILISFPDFPMSSCTFLIFDISNSGRRKTLSTNFLSKNDLFHYEYFLQGGIHEISGIVTNKIQSKSTIST
jgi:hypothetical protein